MSNAGKTHVIFELLQTMEQWQSYVKAHNLGDNRRDEMKIAQMNLRLVKSILLSDPMPQELLTETPCKMLQQYVESQQQKQAE